jgi:tungstate transport system substrate-binding protein
MGRTLLGVLTSVLVLTGGVAGAARADTIRVQSTTDTVDAGLVEGYNGIAGIRALFSQWEAANGLPADTLAYTGVGTGAALTNARGGLADVAITHAPSLEADFVNAGYSYEPLGRAIFYSDYVILGPRADPAGIFAAAPHDAVTAFEKIAAAGAAGNAVFDSRGDNSGTNVQEQVIWGLTDRATTVTQQATGTTDATRREPGNAAPVYPTWYVKTSKGQAANVQQCATTANCYTMTDRGTFNKLVNSGTLPQLKVVSDRNTPSVRGGQNLLVNPFTAYIVNPNASFPAGSPTPNVAAATRFVDFLTSDFFQDKVASFPSASDPAFRPDAFPAVGAAVPPVVGYGGAAELDVTLTDKLPGGGPVVDLPVQLQASTDGGQTFNNVGGPSTTNGVGGVSFRPTGLTAAATTYRVALPRYKKFSANVQTLGVVSVPQPVKGPPPPTNLDKTPPAVTKATLSAKKLSFRIDEAGTVKATIKIRKTRKVNGKTRTTYVTVKKLTIFATKAGTFSRAFRTLKPGTYHVTLQATDRSGNAKTRTATLIIKHPKKTKSTR